MIALEAGMGTFSLQFFGGEEETPMCYIQAEGKQVCGCLFGWVVVFLGSF